MKPILLVLSLLWVVLLAACSGEENSLADRYKGQSAEQIFHKAQLNLVKESFKEAVEQFEALDTLYPFSDYEEEAQMDIIYAYYQAKEYTSASAAAARYIHLYPTSEYVDYAYYMKGMAHYSENRGFSGKYFKIDFSQRDLASVKQAYDDFYDLIERFPHSIYVPNAHFRMVYLRNLMADYELNIAQYYYKNGRYLAAINRADNVLQHYQQAPAMVQALGILVDSYAKLKLNVLSDKAFLLLQINYPHSEVYEQLRAKRKVSAS